MCAPFLREEIAVGTNARRIRLIAAVLLTVAVSLAAEKIDVQAVVSRTQNDIAAIRYYAATLGKEVACFDAAQYDVADFGRDYARGHFDQDKLDLAIYEIQDILDNRMPGPKLRDELTADLQDLRRVRAEYDSGASPA